MPAGIPFMEVTNCIPEEALQRLHSGDISDDAAAEWEAHLLSCPDCLQRIRMVNATDPLSSALGEVRQLPNAPADPPIVDELMQRLSDRQEMEALSQTAVSMAAEYATQRLDSDAIRASSASHVAAIVTSARLPAGTQLGPYRIIAKLGAGGMGAVYKATHTKLDKVVALKILSLDATRHPDALARFEREMRAIGKLEHPHIVRAMDAGELQGVHFLAMEYVDGTDLQRHIKEQGPLSIDQACDFVRQAAEALAAAHHAGLVHRDIKPSNLLLGQHGTIKLLDLGLALLADDTPTAADLTTAGQSFGTPDYMAPEQWEDAHAADSRSDLYALGCTLFYLLTGRAPFGTETCRTAVAKMKAHVTEPPPSLRSTRAEVPAELEAIYRRLMEKHPRDRFASADELVTALVAFARSRAASSFDGATTERELSARSVADHTATSMDRHRGKRFNVGMALGGSALVCLLGVIVVTIINRDGTRTSLKFPTGTQVDIDAKPDSKVIITESDVPTGTPREVTSPIADIHEAKAPTLEPPAPAVAPFQKHQARAHQEAWARYYGVPVDYTNSLGMKFRLIPPGEFVMGGTPKEVAEGLQSAGNDVAWIERVRSEAPQHRVKIVRPFYLGVHEVTQDYYRAVMGQNPSDFSATGDRKEDVANVDTSCFPVERVSWFDAIDFCNKLSDREGHSPFYRREGDVVKLLPSRGYSLPTEA